VTRVFGFGDRDSGPAVHFPGLFFVLPIVVFFVLVFFAFLLLLLFLLVVVLRVTRGIQIRIETDPPRRQDAKYH